MNNHLNILQKQAKCDLKSSKMLGGWGSVPDPAGELTALPRPLNREETPVMNSWLRYCIVYCLLQHVTHDTWAV